jgi:hypothetical protein
MARHGTLSIHLQLSSPSAISCSRPPPACASRKRSRSFAFRARVAGCSAILSALAADLAAAAIAAFCLLLPEEKTFMVPAPVLHDKHLRAMSGARLFVQGSPKRKPVKLLARAILPERAGQSRRDSSFRMCAPTSLAMSPNLPRLVLGRLSGGQSPTFPKQIASASTSTCLFLNQAGDIPNKFFCLGNPWNNLRFLKADEVDVITLLSSFKKIIVDPC